MKNNILFSVIIVFTLNVRMSYAQRDTPLINLEHMDSKDFQWGYYFGANYLDFKFDYKKLKYDTSFDNRFYKEIQVKNKFSFNVGLTSSLRITDHIHLRLEPGFIYTQRNLYFPGFTKEDKKDFRRIVRSTYLHAPLLVKISTKRWFNFKPYIIGGGSATYNLSSGSDFEEDSSKGRFRTTNYNFFYEFGIGIDFYTPYFRVSPSIRGIFGINNELIPDNPRADGQPSPWTGNIDKLRTQGFLINIILE